MSTPAHVTFFLLPGFNLAALGAAAGVLAEEARHIPFTTMGLDGAPVSASCGIALRPDRRAEEMAAETAILIILAGRVCCCWRGSGLNRARRSPPIPTWLKPCAA